MPMPNKLKKLSSKTSNNIKIVTNEINGDYITNTDTWTVDETFYNKSMVVFIIYNLKTRAIVSYCTKYLKEDEVIKTVKFKNLNYKVGLNSHEVLDIYRASIEAYGAPYAIHSDNNPSYFSKEIEDFCKEYNIKLSKTGNQPRSNQPSEGLNGAIKQLTIMSIHKENSRPYKRFRLGWEDRFKNIRIETKASRADFRKMFFTSDFFKTKINFHHHVKQAILQHNQKPMNKKKNCLLKQEAQNATSSILTLSPIYAKNNTDEGNKIIADNYTALELAHSVTTAIDLLPELDEKERQELKQKHFIYQPEPEFSSELQKIFKTSNNEVKPIIESLLLVYADLKKSSNRISDENAKLLISLNDLKFENKKKDKLIESLEIYLNNIKELEEIKRVKKDKLKNRKRRPQTQPLEYEDLYEAIKYFNSEESDQYQEITKIRIKAILILTFITGVRISELRYITIAQVLTLIRKGFLVINKQKRGRSNHKSYLSPKGKQILKQYSLEILDLCKFTGIKIPDKALDNYYIKPYVDTYFFSSPNNKGTKPYTRPHFTNAFNKIINEVPAFKKQSKNFTSHSLRYAYINGLWKDTQDIEFVRQAIGHSSIQTTSGYTKQLTDKEMEKRMNDIPID